MEKTAEQLTSLIDVNTVIGKPIVSSSGAQIIPFTKVTMGYMSGGGDYGTVKKVKMDESVPFAGGAGTIINLKPIGFLIDDGTTCRIVQVSDGAFDNLMNKASDLIDGLADKITNV